MTSAKPPVKEVHVAVAVIIRNGQVLIARRPDHVHQGGLLEFPGGKVEPGERVQAALVREIAEETGLRVPETSLEPVIGIRHDYGDKRVFLDVWATRAAEGEPEGREGQLVGWRSPDRLRDQDFPAANRPVIRALRLPRQLAITGAAAGSDQAIEGLRTGLADASQALVVLRAPAITGPDYRQLAAAAVPVCEAAGAGLIVHGAPEVFHGTPGARGLHLPWREAAKQVKRPVPADAWLGVSCHDAMEIDHAVAIGADYVTLGPVKPTRSHPGELAMGWEAFGTLVSGAPVPVYGLGGLGLADLSEARQQGGQGIAGIGFWWPEN
ncbi:Nudix family hydrolase [Marinobacter sp. SS8-8]|uniref:Nudix family hydrolase n=1 Tax=Marinobacter sp. SS8-8 TaxID=3050452 RepID=UPI0026E0F9D5|nr:Nudix family hydrolase [Marinobacter sp. SS8-8]|tara:strand:- start:3320 stop:4291 length:972 start_codon:yes stop_codon:yes gene_type:complete